ncbi:DUF962 domain-containing protein [Emcibacter sp.]|uniref:Mpo1 family 2-hydroxy fatty acid dioxygenase n=1 Tax=Emcibacter sp. TaxID=1979954 RepID=UPI002AA84186|nr:Mpo1-like protein [Emcibacter sp.]
MKEFFIKQMAMYSAYHMDGRNQLTHYIGVPSIVVSLFMAFSWIDVFATNGMQVTFAMIFIAIILMFYLFSDLLIGLIAAAVFIPLLKASTYLAPLPDLAGWMWFAVLFVGGWIFQLVGHVFEGRKPALLDNLFQIFMAPSFLIAEALFHLGLHRGLKEEIGTRVGEYAA